MIIMSDLNGVFRSALVAVLTAGMLAYLARSARKYSDRKVGLTMAEQPNTTFDFPIVSVCAIVPEFKPADDYSPWMLWARHDVMKGTEEDGGGKKKIFHMKTYPNGTSTGEGKILQLLTVSNNNVLLCNIYVSPKGYLTPYSVYHELLIAIDDPPRSVAQKDVHYAVMVGHRRTLTFGHFVGTTYILVPSEPNKFRSFKIPVRFGERHRLRSEHKCLEEEELRDIEDGGSNMYLFICTDKYLSARVPCLNGGKGNASNLCGEEEVFQIFSEIQDMIMDGESKFLDKIGCPGPCVVPTYEIEAGTPFERELQKDEKNGVLYLSFYGQKPITTVRHEYLLYDLGSLAGDVGGMLGLLLGASALAFYDALHQMGTRVLARHRHRKQKG